MRLNTVFAVATALFMAAPAFGQDNAPASAPQQTSFPWGIIGAVGLIGLLGARKRAS